MPTYHIAVVPKPGQDPAPGSRPLSPRDITADSEADALEEARSLVGQEIGSFQERAPLMPAEKEAQANRAAAMSGQWILVVRLVNRLPVDIKPRSVAIDQWRDGEVVGQIYDYGVASGKQSFDVLVGDDVCGRLSQQNADPLAVIAPVWRLDEGTGLLAGLLGQSWVDLADAGHKGMFKFPEAPLAGIRAALEKPPVE